MAYLTQMTPFTFLTPSRMHCGPGSATDGTLATEARKQGKRPLIVHGGSLRRSGALEAILATLPEATTYEVPSREPTVEDADAAMAAAKEANADMILAIGGGSALDVGKTAALAPLNRTTREFLSGQASATDPRALPILAVPTTAGTGSEATVSVVFTDPDAVKKASFRGESLLPKTVILDAELLKTCPLDVMAHSSMDALVQAIESYMSIGANLYTRPLAAQAAESIYQAIRGFSSVTTSDDLTELLMGSYMAGVALNTSRLGLVHGLAHPIGAHTGAAHGLLCGLLMPHVLSFNVPNGGGIDGLTRYTSKGMEDYSRLFTDVLEIVDSPTKLSELGVKESDLPAIAAESMPSGSTKANPRPVSEADALAVLQAAF
ncbi:MAG: iron-containing alcohol dehydrogenase [Armatimonas sp.]